jgi:multidrug efflux pump subunit AcrB
MIGFIAGVGIIVRNSIILVRLALFDSEDTLMGSAGAAATAVRTLTLDRARSARSVP